MRRSLRRIRLAPRLRTHLRLSMAKTLFTLAYPFLSATDRAVVDAIRAKHDRAKAAMVRPHFTLVFGCAERDEDEYLNHVGAIAATTTRIQFHCRYAMLGAGGADDAVADHAAHVFLVPDEGNSAIMGLHDRLYTGILSSRLRHDIQYVAHITLATCADSKRAKRLCDEINAQAVSIAGKIEALTVSAVDGREFSDLRSFPLI